jgi:AbrB family looped-hinge helix DNA binding protein
MRATLTQNGRVTLPVSLRKRLRLKAGDGFEIGMKDENTIVLRRVARPANHGLVDHLLACPVKGWFQPIR